MAAIAERRRRILRASWLASTVLAAVLLLWSLIAVNDARGQVPEPTVSVLGEATLSVNAVPNEDEASVPLIVVNQGPAPVQIGSITFEAASWIPGASSPVVRDAGVRVDDFRPDGPLPAGATRLVVILAGLKQLTNEPVDGQLILYSKSGDVLGARSVSITPASQPSANWPELFFWVGAGLFVALAVASLITLVAHAPGRDKALRASAPGPDWTWDGWGGRLAALSGLLAVVLGEITLPAIPREVSKSTLTQMNLIFVGMLAVGPFIFYALRRRTPPDEVELGDMEEKGVWGRKPILLLSYVVTAVAVTGEIGALTLLGWEITNGTWHIVVLVIAAILTLLTWRSFWLATYTQAKQDWDESAQTEPLPGDEPLKKKHEPIRVTNEKPSPESQPVPTFQQKVS